MLLNSVAMITVVFISQVHTFLLNPLTKEMHVLQKSLGIEQYLPDGFLQLEASKKVHRSDN